MRLGYIPIYTYKNDGILFYKDNEQVIECPKCDEPRYKTKNKKKKKKKEDILKDFEVFSIDSKTSKIIYVHKDS